jgi:hypothetical protein
MNSGIARAIREKWPIVYQEYLDKYVLAEDMALDSKDDSTATDYLLGAIQNIPVKMNKTNVINMFAQANYGYDGRRYTSYDAFWSCLGQIKEQIPKGSIIGFPKGIGSCRGGADWEVIRTMIERALGEDYQVRIYELE